MLLSTQLSDIKEDNIQYAMNKDNESTYGDNMLGRIERLDHSVFHFLYGRLRNPVFDVLMPFLSIVANRGILQIVLGTAMIIVGFRYDIAKLRNAAYCMLAASASAGVIAEFTVKKVWKRRRPFMVFDDVAAIVNAERLSGRASFPSGHSAGFMAMALSLSIYYPALSPYLIAVGLLGSYSRIYNGVHFPTDVAAGILIGIAAGIVVTRLMMPVLPV